MGEKVSHSGGCLCGAVRYRLQGALRPVVACHCGQCRRQSGHYVVGTAAKGSDFEFISNDTLKWFRSSTVARRGFCGSCGSVLFWQDGGGDMGINAGSLDQPTGLKLKSHIFVDDKADYYEIEDDLPKFAGSDQPL